MANKYNTIQRNTINIFLFVNVSLNFKYYNFVSMLFEQFFWVPSLKKPFFKVYDILSKSSLSEYILDSLITYC